MIVGKNEKQVRPAIRCQCLRGRARQQVAARDLPAAQNDTCSDI
jgi:hypothetical protein